MKVIEKAIKLLLDTNPFYAHFFLNSKIVYDVPGVPTASATLTPSSVMMCFNSKFVEALTPQQVCGVVEHETLHVLFNHTSAVVNDKNLNKQVANIAMDLSINQWIAVLPPECVTLESVKQMTGLTLEPQQTWEHYYHKLMKKAEETAKMSPMDVHDLQGQDGNQPAISEGEAKAIIRAHMDKAVKQAKGLAPSHVMKVLDALSNDAKLPWQQILANFVARTTKTTTKPTRKRPNRRFGLSQPGKNKKRELTLGVCADSSGSVSDEAYTSFLTEIQRISKHCEVYLIDADCVVQNVKKIKKNSKIENKRFGGGGTAYQPAITACMERHCDAVVYFGDGDTADVPKDPGVPVLWVFVGGNKERPGNFGALVELS